MGVVGVVKIDQVVPIALGHDLPALPCAVGLAAAVGIGEGQEEDLFAHSPENR